jgi:glutamate-5-semialdehyde dehydrogenase
VIHDKISKEFLPLLYDRLHAKEVEIRADERGCAICKGFVPATQEDYGTEYLDKIISLKVVDSIEEAIAHIRIMQTL